MAKVGKIFIHGEIAPDAEYSSIPEFTSLIDVISQVKKLGDVDSYEVEITSHGGYLYEGFEIVEFLNSLNKPIKTIGKEIVASAATVIFLSGDVREVEASTIFMIHLPSGGVRGNSEDIREYNERMQKTKDKVVKYYSDKLNITKEGVFPLLKYDTYLNIDELYELGFTTIEPSKIMAVARYDDNNNKLNNLNIDTNMDFTKKEANAFKKFINMASKMFAEPENSLTLQTTETDEEGNAVELEFEELTHGDKITEGVSVKASNNVNSGEFLMPNGDKYIVKNGKISSVEVKEDEKEEELQEAEALETLKAELAAEKKALETLKAELEAEKEAKQSIEAKMSIVKNETKELKEALKGKFDFEMKQNSHEPKKDNKGTNDALNRIKERRAKRGLK